MRAEAGAFLAAFLADERGEDLIEYGLLAAFVAAVATAVLISHPATLEHALKRALNRAKDALNNA
jgi:Flp pilus assembly pilin Flp